LSNTRLFFATDVHGSDRCFRKFINAGQFYKAQVLVLGGDVAGKMMVPVVQQADHSYTSKFLGKDWKATKDKELNDLQNRIKVLGYYPFLTTESETAELQANPTLAYEKFTKLMVETMKGWLDLAEQHLKPKGTKMYITGGNDDPKEVLDVLEKSSFVKYAESQVLEVDEHHEMASTGYSNMSPWHCPRDITEEELLKKIEGEASKVKKMSTCIFNMHCPPFGTHLDQAPELDKDLRPIKKGGQIHMTNVGSTAVRSAIEKYQPVLGLHGHIHESRGVDKVGQTLCINPGSEYTEGILRGAVLNLTSDGFESYALVTG